MKPCNSYIPRASIKCLLKKKQAGRKTTIQKTMPEKTPRRPHRSRAPYSLLSLLTSRAPRNFSDAQNLLHTLFFSLTSLGQSFPPRKNVKEKGLSLFPFWLFIPEPLLLPFPPSFFPPSALESVPINLENQLHKHSPQS